MAAKTDPSSGFAPVLSALATMQSNVAGREKTQAHEFLETFQKSVSSEFDGEHFEHTLIW